MRNPNLRRAALLLTLAAGLAAPMAVAQQPDKPAATTQDRNPLQLVLDSLRLDPNGATIAPADVGAGTRLVGPKERITGDAASWHGPLEVRGTVDGNAVAIGGDVIIRKGGRVRGDALSVGGQVQLDGGSVDGEMRSLSALTVGAPRRRAQTPAQSMRHSLSLSVGWYLVLTCIGVGVLLVARPPLEAVTDTVRSQTMRAFAIGLLGQLAVAPTMVLGILALAITVIGVLVIPFAAVAYVAAVAGASALGFLAVALVLGQAMSGGRNGDRGFVATLQPLLLGLSLFLILWFAGNGLAWAGGVGTGLRVAASAITWATLTIGFGAVLMTRAGTRPSTPPAQLTPAPTAEHEWQTPTPVTGVAAARRPTPAPRRGTGER